MSCDFGVWFPSQQLDSSAAGELYGSLCQGDTSGVEPSSAIDAFFLELTSIHPEIDDVPEEAVGDMDRCPWSIAFDRSPGHLIMCCVWSKAEYVEALIKRLASKHGLVVYDPQASAITYPQGSGARPRQSRHQLKPNIKPWWRFW